MKKKRIFIYALPVIIAGIVFYWYFIRDNTTSVTTCKTEAVKRATISNTVTATVTKPVSYIG